MANAADVRVVAKLRRSISRFRPDVVHSHLAVADIASVAASAPNRICTVHNPGVELDRIKRWLWHRALPRFRVVTAVSEAVRRSLPVPARVLHPSLVSDRDPLLSRSRARRRLGLCDDGPVVLAVGRLHPIKGFDILAGIAARLDATVAIVGEGPQRDALATGAVRLLGAHAHAASLMAAADVLVMPSRSEGFPQVPLQAMAAGVPVVATRVGGTPEIVVDGDTGRLVPPEDPEALAAALTEVLASPALARKWGQAGQHRLAQADFTRDAMIRATVSLYAEVTGKYG